MWPICLKKVKYECLHRSNITFILKLFDETRNDMWRCDVTGNVVIKINGKLRNEVVTRVICLSVSFARRVLREGHMNLARTPCKQTPIVTGEISRPYTVDK